MRISVFGLGPVGCVTAACLAQAGHTVTGVEIDPTKRELVRQGRTAIREPGLETLLLQGLDAHRLQVTDCATCAVKDTELSFVCVGTPGRADGSLDLRFTEHVSRQLGEALREKPAYHVVAFRSTMLPGSVDDVLVPILEQHSGKRAGRDFGVAYNPEFLREGISLHDFHHPSRTVIGQRDVRGGDVLTGIYAGVDAPLVRTSIRAAEMVKYADNAFHALKVTFANEIGRICKQDGLDSHEVMEIFTLDTRLNLSPAYLKPGFAFGGSCLPKDLRALTHHARGRDLRVPVLESIMSSNAQQMCAALELILRQDGRRIGILGLSFKAGTDDLRESPVLDLVGGLIDRGREVGVYDRHVPAATTLNTNGSVGEHAPLPASRLYANLDDLLHWADVLVIAIRDAAYDEVAGKLRDDQTVVDLVRIPNQQEVRGRYVGLSW